MPVQMHKLTFKGLTKMATFIVIKFGSKRTWNIFSHRNFKITFASTRVRHLALLPECGAVTELIHVEPCTGLWGAPGPAQVHRYRGAQGFTFCLVFWSSSSHRWQPQEGKGKSDLCQTLWLSSSGSLFFHYLPRCLTLHLSAAGSCSRGWICL